MASVRAKKNGLGIDPKPLQNNDTRLFINDCTPIAYQMYTKCILQDKKLKKMHTKCILLYT